MAHENSNPAPFSATHPHYIGQCPACGDGVRVDPNDPERAVHKPASLGWRATFGVRLVDADRRDQTDLLAAVAEYCRQRTRRD
jgi:hypothetical protein